MCGDLVAEGLLDLPRPLLEAAVGPAGARQVDPAEADRLDAVLLEPRQPGVVALGVLRATVDAGVLEPHLDVRRQVGHLPLDHPGVAALGDPAGQALVPGLVAQDHPVREDLQPAAVVQVVRSGAHDVLDDAVAGHPGVAVDQSLARRRRDHERRVGHDQVEGLPAHRVEEAAFGAGDSAGRACRDLVQGGVEPGEPERSRVQVAGDHPVGVLGEVQRLHPAPGAEIERRSDRLADGELRERGGGRADPEHVVGRDDVGRAVQPGCQVGRDPQVTLVGGVRADVHPCGHLAHRSLQDRRRTQPVDQPGQSSLGRLDADRRLQQEEPGERLDRRTSPRRPHPRHRLVARERRMRRRPEQVGHPVEGVARRRQRGTKLRHEFQGPRHAARLRNPRPGRPTGSGQRALRQP